MHFLVMRLTTVCQEYADVKPLHEVSHQCREAADLLHLLQPVVGRFSAVRSN